MGDIEKLVAVAKWGGFLDIVVSPAGRLSSSSSFLICWKRVERTAFCSTR